MASSRRRPLRSAQHTNLPAHSRTRTDIGARITQAACSPTAKTLYVVIGSAGLAALAIAIFGPQRFERQIVKPVKSAVGDQANQLWADFRPLREQIGKLFARAQSETGRDRLVRNFQSWIGHFRAS